MPHSYLPVTISTDRLGRIRVAWWRFDGIGRPLADLHPRFALTGLDRYAGSKLRQRGSSPKLLALDTGLMTAKATPEPEDARTDRTFRGRLVETAIGAHLIATAGPDVEVTWWRVGDREVDFVLARGSSVLAIEVGGCPEKSDLRDLAAFTKAFPAARPPPIGARGLPLETALSTPADEFLD